MRADRWLSRLALLCACTTAALAVVPSDPATLDAANRAYAAGEHERALELYDDTLDEDPGNLQALLTSAKLLSWERRYDEAIERYDRALSRDPDNHAAALERARVLSWARRYREAAGAFGGLLARDPRDGEARLGLARSLSWSGRQRLARAEYERLLADDPGHPEALVGIAQTWAWSGDHDRARESYRRALSVKPGMREALLGLAYVDLWDGNTRAARQQADNLGRRFPEDDEVAELSRAVAQSMATWLLVTTDRLEDTDDNELGIWRLEIGKRWSGRLETRLGLVRYDMESPAGTGAIDSLYVVADWRAAPRHRLTLRAGADRREPGSGADTTIGIGGVTWAWEVAPRWTVRASGQRDTFRYSTAILERPGNTIETYELGFEGTPSRWIVRGSVGAWDLSDGNSREGADGAFGRRFRVGRHELDTGYRLRLLDYDRDLTNGYFDPSDFSAHVLWFHARGRVGTGRAYYEVLLESGVQSFELGGVEVSDDRILAASGSLGYPFRSVAIELFAMTSDYALESGTGFESDQIGLRLRWRGSGR